MTRLALSLAVIGVLAACAEEPVSPPVRANVTSQPPVVVSQPSQPVVVTPPSAAAPATIIVQQPAATPYRAGFGVVESSSLVARPNAAAGGTARGVYRLGLRMDDGTVQMIDIDSRAFMVGDRVQVTSNGHVIRP